MPTMKPWSFEQHVVAAEEKAEGEGQQKDGGDTAQEARFESAAQSEDAEIESGVSGLAGVRSDRRSPCGAASRVR